MFTKARLRLPEAIDVCLVALWHTIKRGLAAVEQARDSRAHELRARRLIMGSHVIKLGEMLSRDLDGEKYKVSIRHDNRITPGNTLGQALCGGNQRTVIGQPCCWRSRAQVIWHDTQSSGCFFSPGMARYCPRVVLFMGPPQKGHMLKASSHQSAWLPAYAE